MCVYVCAGLHTHTVPPLNLHSYINSGQPGLTDVVGHEPVGVVGSGHSQAASPQPAVHGGLSVSFGLFNQQIVSVFGFLQPQDDCRTHYHKLINDRFHSPSPVDFIALWYVTLSSSTPTVLHKLDRVP